MPYQSKDGSTGNLGQIAIPVTRPKFDLFETVLAVGGGGTGVAMVTGITLTLQPTFCYWSYWLEGDGIDNSCSFCEEDLNLLSEPKTADQMLEWWHEIKAGEQAREQAREQALAA